jgi:membrane protein YdbS with pleckstrin-like domain
MYGTAPDIPDALAVRSGFLARRKRRVVPADAIQDIDDASGVIGLRVGRDSLKSFL